MLRARRVGIARIKGGGVSWRTFTAGLTEAQLLDVDFGYTDRHFQTSSGETLADAGEHRHGVRQRRVGRQSYSQTIDAQAYSRACRLMQRLECGDSRNRRS